MGLNELESKYCELNKDFFDKIKELDGILDNCSKEGSKEYREVYKMWEELLKENI